MTKKHVKLHNFNKTNKKQFFFERENLLTKKKTLFYINLDRDFLNYEREEKQVTRILFLFFFLKDRKSNF
jgi:hypothetical protein